MVIVFSFGWGWVFGWVGGGMDFVILFLKNYLKLISIVMSRMFDFSIFLDFKVLWVYLTS